MEMLMNKKFTSLVLISFFTVGLLSAISVVQAVPAPDWTVQLTATINTFSTNCVFGVSSSAINGWDQNFDAPIPPSNPAGVSSWFYVSTNPSSPVNLQKLSTSIISSGDVWLYKIKSIDQVGTVIITWSGTSDIPAGFNIYLQDSSGNTLANLRTNTQYQFSAESDTTYNFKIQIVPAFPLPEYPLGACLAIGACFAAFVLYKKRGSLPNIFLK
jgi:hypothetical protein